RVAGLSGELLRLDDESREDAVLASSRWLDVVLRQSVGRAVEDAFLEILRIGILETRARTERLHGGGRARRDAAHERQRAPEAQPLSLDVLAGRGDDRRAVREHAVEEAFPRARQLIRQLDGNAAREQATIAPLGDIGAPALHKVAREPFAQL